MKVESIEGNFYVTHQCGYEFFLQLESSCPFVYTAWNSLKICTYVQDLMKSKGGYILTNFLN